MTYVLRLSYWVLVEVSIWVNELVVFLATEAFVDVTLM
jgi:hypothetical protein